MMGAPCFVAAAQRFRGRPKFAKYLELGYSLYFLEEKNPGPLERINQQAVSDVCLIITARYGLSPKGGSQILTFNGLLRALLPDPAKNMKFLPSGVIC